MELQRHTQEVKTIIRHRKLMNKVNLRCLMMFFLGQHVQTNLFRICSTLLSIIISTSIALTLK